MTTNFLIHRVGDVLPSVSVVQMLLKRTGIAVTADGNYGEKTKNAVKEFQRAHPGLQVDGRCGRQTWVRLKGSENLPIVDCIDVFDPDLYTSEAKNLLRAGSDPLTIGGMCNGIEQAVSMILRQYSDIFLLRFHGHGLPGIAGVSDGESSESSNSSFEDNAQTSMAFRKLKAAFGHYGCVQFMHCQTGRGTAGTKFLTMASHEMGVPVSAAINDQYGSSVAETMRFEGRTKSACPNGAALRHWSSSRRAFAGMSVA